MKNINQSLAKGISMLLLLLFAVTILPLDSLHSHSTAEQVCSDKQTSCSHTVHITKKADYCWICAIHYDKVFTSPNYQKVSTELPVVKLLIDNAFTGYVAEILYTALRGPPSE